MRSSHWFNINTRKYSSFKLLTYLIIPLFWSQLLLAEEVVLNPVEVAGKVNFLDKEIRSLRMTAISDDYRAQISNAYDEGITDGDYSITVNVEEGQSRDYVLVAFSRGADGRTYGYKPVTVSATDTDPAQVTSFDISQTEVGHFVPDIQVPAGVTITSATFLMSFNSYPIYYWDKLAGSYTLTDFTGDLSHPVPPGESITVNAKITIQHEGKSHLFEFHTYVIVGANQTHVQPYVIELAETTSLLTKMNVDGPAQVTGYDFSTKAPDSPWSRKIYRIPAGSNYYENLREDLPVSKNYLASLAVQYLYEDYRGYVRMPSEVYNPGTLLDLSEPNTVHELEVFANQAFILGKVQLSDNVSHMDASGSVGYQSSGSYYNDANAYLNESDLSYRQMTVDANSWRFHHLNLLLSRDDGNRSRMAYYRPDVNVNPYLEFSALEERSEIIDLSMGSVTINYSVSDNSLLSRPELEVDGPNSQSGCFKEDSEGRTLYNYRPIVNNLSQNDVELGHVTLYGPSASCRSLIASARVNGSETTFGVLDFDIQADVDVVIDIGGPQLTVDVEPNALVSGETLIVTGRVTDDVEVTSVTVNGIEAVLSDSNNQEDPNERLFSVEIPVALGANILETIATDSSNKQSQDRRTVYRDESAPLISLLPADGSVFIAPESMIIVRGEVSDDLDVESVSINGESVSLTPAGAGRYTFSLEMNLDNCGFLPCETQVNVEAKDTVGRTSSLTHVLTLKEEQVQICGDLDGDQDVDGNDRSLFLGSLRSSEGQPNYNQDADYDSDGIISFNDYRAWYQCFNDYRAAQ